MLCIQVPISETSCPLKKSWKLRWRSARKVAGNAIARVGEAFRACGSELGGLLKAESFKSFFRYFTILDTNRNIFLQSVRMPPLHDSIQSGLGRDFSRIWGFPDAARSCKVEAFAEGCLSSIEARLASDW